jgi:putative superfamily III holin-X
LLPNAVKLRQLVEEEQLGDLAHESAKLLRLEFALARAELEAKLGQLGTGAVEMAVGGLIIYAGFAKRRY